MSLGLGLGLGLGRHRASGSVVAPTVTLTSPTAGTVQLRYSYETLTVSGTFANATAITVYANVDGTLYSWGSATLGTSTWAYVRTIVAADCCGASGYVNLYATATGPGGSTTSSTIAIQITDPVTRLGGFVAKTTSGVTYATQYPLTNGGFETADTTGWTASTGVTATVEAGARTGGTGSYVCRLATTATDAQYVYQTPGLAAGARTKNTGWIKLEAVGPTPQLGGTSVPAGIWTGSSSTTAWQNFTVYKSISTSYYTWAIGLTYTTLGYQCLLDDLTEDILTMVSWTDYVTSGYFSGHYWNQGYVNRSGWLGETYVNGVPMVDFNGTSNRYLSSGLSAANNAYLHRSQGCYLAVVMTPGSGTTGVGSILDTADYSAANAGISLVRDRASSLVYFYKGNATSTWLVSLSAASTASTTQVVEAWTSEAAGSSLAINGGTASTAAAYTGSSTANAAGLLYLGATAVSWTNFIAGQVGEHWVLTGVPTAAERTALVTYLKSKHGIA